MKWGVSCILVVALVCVATPVFAQSDVIELEPKTFDQFVGGDEPVFVEFFAPWCGHCKALAPEYEIVATAFKHLPVKIASVDADAHKSLGTRFGVSGYPTLKFFPAGSLKSEPYPGGRSADAIIDFINQQTGLHAKVKKAPSAVVTLTRSNFDAVVMDESKDVLVEFYAPWCGHCKRLEPEYEKVAASFVGEADVLIAKMNADDHAEIATKYDVSGYPTIKFFPRDNKAGEDYKKGRTPQDFVDFINERSGTARTVGGGYTDDAGRIEALDALASQYLEADASMRESLLEQAETAVTANKYHKYAAYAKFYVINMKRIRDKGDDFIATETARLQRLIESGSITEEKMVQFSMRLGIAKQF